MSAVTYQSVAKVCNHLRIIGEKPSVRKIKAELGGSHTVIGEFLKRWRAETQLSESSDMAISEELQHAILAEFAQVALQVQSSFKETIEENELDLKETSAALHECELTCRKQELEIDELKRKLHNDTLNFEKKIAAYESSVNFLKDRELDLQKKCAEANEKMHEAKVQTAIANTKADNFQNRLLELEQQLKEKR